VQAISGRADDHDPAGRPAGRGDARRNGICLPERELTASRA